MKKIPTFRPPQADQARQLSAREYDSKPDRKEDIAWYHSAAWKALRQAFLWEFPLCAECQREGRLTPAKQVHHVRPRKEYPDLALDQRNLEGLCTPCHTRLENRGRPKG